ncbi:hypothetical protein IAR55_005932 [Kwoniella newhampshirensis]|uniref:Uncharacterized protein n=1 Tax=Kwoniella newhampshirensis TaxID=1651941 RepID=A0AAW0YVD0_9TREE
MPLPASHTKHLDLLVHSIPRQPDHLLLPLRQISSGSGKSGSTGTTGTTLWLSGQVLSAYLSSVSLPQTLSTTNNNNSNNTLSSSSLSGKNSGVRPQVLELGAGIGYTSLCLASTGWDVVSTDIEPVLSGVLRGNIEDGLRVIRANLSLGSVGGIEVRELDWERVTSCERDTLDWLDQKEWDMIVMTDTFYAPHLIGPLWDTLAYVSTPRIASTSHPPTSTQETRQPPGPLSTTMTSKARTPPPIYIGIEIRDPSLISQALEHGRKRGFELKKVGRKRVGKEVERWGWKSEDWEGVEVWKAKWRGGGPAPSAASN